MTSTSSVVQCACGCRAFIFPIDDHPWFKRNQCQQLWQAFNASGLPEEAFVQWSWDQRFRHELWNGTPWRMGYWCDVLTDVHIVSMANSMLDSAGLKMMKDNDPDLVTDAYRIASYYRHANEHLYMAAMVEYIPEWARIKFRKNIGSWRLPDRLVDTLKQYGLERPAQDDAADLVAPA